MDPTIARDTHRNHVMSVPKLDAVFHIITSVNCLPRFGTQSTTSDKQILTRTVVIPRRKLIPTMSNQCFLLKRSPIDRVSRPSTIAHNQSIIIKHHVTDWRNRHFRRKTSLREAHEQHYSRTDRCRP